MRTTEARRCTAARASGFVYLTWGTVGANGFSMFRRAKLMLADVPTALRAEPVIAVEVPLTQDDGSPRCARIPADLLRWTSEVQ